MLQRIISFILVISLALPAFKDWDHLLSGKHKEIHCDEGIPNHFHQAEFDCDFHKFHFSISLGSYLWEYKTPVAQIFLPPVFGYRQRISRAAFRDTDLRGPPCSFYL